MMKKCLQNSPKSSPKASPSRKSTTLQHLLDLDSKNISMIPSSSPRKMRQSSLDSENEGILSIISNCSIVFNFTDPLESPSQQDLKRNKLIQLLGIVKSPNPFPEKVLPSLVSMIAVNLFRPLPPSCTYNTITSADLLPDDEDFASTLSPTWQHLQIVYDILLRLVLNIDPKVLRELINQSFLLNLLSLFQSDDPREREILKNVFHRIYLRFTFHRSFMRKSMNQVFLHYAFETEKHNGIAELLEIWGSIINGFTVPLKEEHKLFLMRVLIPLHKTKGVQFYHRQLSYCVNQFVQKEPMLGGIVVRGLLRYWPITNWQKEILLIGELEELVDNIDPGHYRKLALPISTRITRCLNSWNSQVAERALYIWNNEQLVKLVSSAIEEVLPVVVEGMEKNLKCHWSDSVKQLTEDVKAMLQEMYPSLYENSVQEIEQRQFLARQRELKRKETWERIELEAAKNHFLQPHHLLCLSH